MSTILVYNRYFDRATARRGDTVKVTFELIFQGPPMPEPGLWFDNIGDNLGGSTGVNGPLDYLNTVSSGTSGLIPGAVSSHSIGVSPAVQGCFRMWTDGTSYPSPTTPISKVWKPLGIGGTCFVRVVVNYKVHASAVIGLVISPVVNLATPNDTNFTVGDLMIDAGPSCTVAIATNAPGGGNSRTLTIVS